MEIYFLLFYLLYGSKNRKKEYYFAEHFGLNARRQNRVKLSHNPPQETNLKSSMEELILIIILKRSWPSYI